ncbi:MAG: hypothetical protein IPH07_08380 [Deltaproteobacteria bacterium]|nr:hypothetical protein [Deltaproteobacteria bacterium]MBK8720049.1 hypothetical protein [Deltaproteobacteria bacterium]MBP7289397.1 hypothetical protein [Nannocystaceae bacterium]
MRRELLLVGVLAALSSCHPKQDRTGVLCSFDVATDGELAQQTLPLSTWMTLVSPSVDRQSLVRQGPWRDSCNQVLQPADHAQCPAAITTDTVVPGDRIELSDLLLTPVSGDRWLGWAATDELTDGQARGTLSLVRWREDGIAVVGTGMVTGWRQSARARMHHASGTEVLVLEGDRCERARSAGATRPCTRVGQFVPLVGGRFRDFELHEAGRGCVGRPQFDLDRSTEIRIDDRTLRSFRLTRSIELDDAGVVLTDLVIVEDRDPRDAAAAPRPFRRATTRRPLVVVDGHFELRDEDLWERVLRDFGGVQQ